MAVDPARLHTSLADIPSQALSTRVCALTGTSEEEENEARRRCDAVRRDHFSTQFTLDAARHPIVVPEHIT